MGDYKSGFYSDEQKSMLVISLANYFDDHLTQSNRYRGNHHVSNHSRIDHHGRTLWQQIISEGCGENEILYLDNLQLPVQMGAC